MSFEFLALVGNGPFPQLFQLRDNETFEQILVLNAAGLIDADMSEDADEVIVHGITEKGRKALGIV